MITIKRNKFISGVISLVGFYACAITFSGLDKVYENWQSFFNMQPIYPALITFITALAPISFLAIAAMVYFNIRKYWLFALLFLGWLFFISYTVYLVIALVIYWWVCDSKLKSV